MGGSTISWHRPLNGIARQQVSCVRLTRVSRAARNLIWKLWKCFLQSCSLYCCNIWIESPHEVVAGRNPLLRYRKIKIVGCPEHRFLVQQACEWTRGLKKVCHGSVHACCKSLWAFVLICSRLLFDFRSWSENKAHLFHLTSNAASWYKGSGTGVYFCKREPQTFLRNAVGEELMLLMEQPTSPRATWYLPRPFQPFILFLPLQGFHFPNLLVHP